MVAVIKAVAVCPDGKLWRLLPSGRVTWVLRLRPSTVRPIVPTVNMSLSIMRPHELRD